MSEGLDYPRQGEIWYIYSPGLPADPHQPRPGLILSENMRNRWRTHLIAVPIYSYGPLGPTRVPLEQGVSGIDHDSVLFREELATIDRYFLASGPLGPPVPVQLLEQVAEAVNRAIRR